MDGILVGHILGFIEGVRDGDLLGWNDDFIVGYKLDNKEGISVGRIVGNDESSIIDGNCVGASLRGIEDGWFVGNFDCAKGRNEGNSVGLVEGSNNPSTKIFWKEKINTNRSRT